MAGSSSAIIRETWRGQAAFKAERSEEPPAGSQSVRSSDEAGNDRGAKGTPEGGRMTDGIPDDQPARVPARANQRWNTSSADDLTDTEGLAGILGDEAKSRSPSQEYPLTGEPDAGDPPVRFGGRGEVNPSSLPLFKKLLCLPMLPSKNSPEPNPLPETQPPHGILHFLSVPIFFHPWFKKPVQFQAI